MTHFTLPFSIQDKGILKLFLYKLHEVSFENTNYGKITIIDENSENQTLNLTFEKEGLYSFKVYSTLSQHDQLMIEIDPTKPNDKKILTTIKEWVTDDNIQIAKHLDPSRDKDSELNKFDRVLEKFCKLYNLDKPTNGKNNGNGVRTSFSSKLLSKKLTIKSYTNGTILTQGSYSKEHENFWKLFLDNQTEDITTNNGENE